MATPRNMQDTTPQSHQPRGLLNLPPELRNQISELVFADSKTMIRMSKSGLRIARHITTEGFAYTGLPGLLLANKQLHQEATGAFNTCTTLIAHEPEHLRLWLHKLSPNVRRAIRHVGLNVQVHFDVKPSMDRVNIIGERSTGYVKAMLKQMDLEMPDCGVAVRVLDLGRGMVMWPSSEYGAREDETPEEYRVRQNKEGWGDERRRWNRLGPVG